MSKIKDYLIQNSENLELISSRLFGRPFRLLSEDQSMEVQNEIQKPTLSEAIGYSSFNAGYHLAKNNQ